MWYFEWVRGGKGTEEEMTVMQRKFGELIVCLLIRRKKLQKNIKVAETQIENNGGVRKEG